MLVRLWMQSMPMSPEIVITEYFELLTRHIDTFTDMTISRLKESQVFQLAPFGTINPTGQAKHKKSSLIDSILTEYDSEPIWDKLSEITDLDIGDNLNKPGHESIQTRVYVEQMRNEMKRELEEAKRQTLEYYETIKAEFNEKMTRDEIESKLFGKNYYFLISFGPKFDTNRPLRMNLVKLDFYLNRRERDILGYIRN